MRRPHIFPRRALTAFGGFVMLAAMVALAGCGAGAASTGLSGTSTNTSSVQRAQSILSKVQANNLKTAHVNTTERLNTNGQLTSTATMITTTSTGDVILQPQYAAQLQTQVMQNGNQQTTANEIVANNTVYVKQGNGNWQTVQLPNNTLNTLPIISLQNINSLNNLHYVGTAQLNGEKVYQLEGVGTQSIGSTNFTYTENIWVGAQNYYPQKVTLTSTTPAGTLEATTTFSQWNQHVSINVPNSSATVTAG